MASGVAYAVCLGSALGVFAGPAFAGASVALATYRAVHDLALDPSKDLPDLADMNGRLVTEYAGADCTGYTTTTRFVTEIEDSEGERHVTDARSVTLENEGTFDFDNQTYDDGTVSESTRGKALRNPAGITIKLTVPGAKTINLGSEVLFPSEQIARIIQAGRDGQHFLSFKAYDGLDKGETVSLTTTVIGGGTTDDNDVGDETPIEKAGYARMLHWPVTISYFDESKGVDTAASYAISALLYENGVMRRLKLSYGQFTLTGKLVQLDVLPPGKCP